MLRVVVQTYDLKTGALEDERVMDYEDTGARRWLGKHCYWAFTNGRGVQTCNLTDHETPEQVAAP